MRDFVRIIFASSVLLLAGCASYYDRHYAGSGVYYGSSFGHSAGYGASPGAYHDSYSGAVLNPVIYPYWSLDHFYFSSFHHPYSVVVGYHEPLYYPYPGWIYGYHRPRGLAGSRGFSVSFGYPWPVGPARYPHYSYGFFVSSSFGHRSGVGASQHRIREIDHRLAALSRPRQPATRGELLRDRHARNYRPGARDPRGNSRTAVPASAGVRADNRRQVLSGRPGAVSGITDRRSRNNIRPEAATERRSSTPSASRAANLQHSRSVRRAPDSSSQRGRVRVTGESTGSSRRPARPRGDQDSRKTSGLDPSRQFRSAPPPVGRESSEKTVSPVREQSRSRLLRTRPDAVQGATRARSSPPPQSSRSRSKGRPRESGQGPSPGSSRDGRSSRDNSASRARARTQSRSRGRPASGMRQQSTRADRRGRGGGR